MRPSPIGFLVLLLVVTFPVNAQESIPWTYVNGPCAGEVHSMLRASDGSLFLGTDMSGIYRSTDGGSSWTQVNAGILDMNIWSLALEPDGDVLAVSYMKPNTSLSYNPSLSSPLGRLFRSSNLGTSWVLVDTITASTRLMGNSLGYIWCERYSDDASGLNRSTNGGTSWTSQGLGAGSFIGSATIDASGNLYVGVTTLPGGGVAIQKSTNYGVGWSSLTGSIGPRALAYKTGGYLFAGAAVGVARIKTDGTGYVVLDNSWQATSFAFSNSGDVYATALDGSVRKSTNNGDTWSTIQPTSVGARRVLCPAGTDVYFSSPSVFLMRSTDAGATWVAVTEGFVNTYVPSLLCSEGNTLYAGTSSSIWKTSDKGMTWILAYNAATRPESYLHFGPSSFPPHYVWALSRGSGSTLAAVQEWQFYQSVTAGYNTCYGHVITTTNDWTSVIDVKTEFSGYQKPGTILPYAAVVGDGNVVHVGGQTGFGKLSGSSFTRLTTPLTGKTVYALTRNRNDTLFAGTLDFGVFRSGTHGDTWAVASGGLPNLDITALAVDSTGRIYGGTTNGLQLSTNNGATWSPATGFPSKKVQAIAAGSGGHVYVATTSYVWFSPNYGTSPWTQLSTGLPTNDITSLAIGPDGDVYAGTWGMGVYRRPAWEATGIAPGPDIPLEFFLSQNYPNPFNPSTTIHYGLPERSRVTLTVFTALGQRVAVLREGYEDAGYHEVSFDGHGLASGIYLYRLDAGSFVQVKKLTLLR